MQETWEYATGHAKWSYSGCALHSYNLKTHKTNALDVLSVMISCMVR